MLSSVVILNIWAREFIVVMGSCFFPRDTVYNFKKFFFQIVVTIRFIKCHPIEHSKIGVWHPAGTRSKAADIVTKGVPHKRLCRQPLCWVQKEQLRHLQRPDKSANQQTFWNYFTIRYTRVIIFNSCSAGTEI